MCVFQDNSWRRPVIMAPEVATQPTTQAHSRPTPTRVGRPPLPVGLVSDAEAAAAAAVPPQPRTTLVLRNVPPRLTTQLLVETVCFKADFAVVVRNPQKGCASCGFAFVNFCDGTSAEQCLNDWQGRESLVGPSSRGSRRASSSTTALTKACTTRGCGHGLPLIAGNTRPPFFLGGAGLARLRRATRRQLNFHRCVVQ